MQQAKGLSRYSSAFPQKLKLKAPACLLYREKFRHPGEDYPLLIILETGKSHLNHRNFNLFYNGNCVKCFA